MPPISAWAAGAVTTLALDLLWLGVLAKGLYRGQVGHLMADAVTWPAALGFYALYGWGVWHFAARAAETPAAALLQGALLGLLVYGTYDLTNLAILKGWTPLITAVDVGWGVLLTALASGAAHLAARKLA